MTGPTWDWPTPEQVARMQARAEAVADALSKSMRDTVAELLARRPDCPLHGIPCEPEPPTLGRGDPPWGDPGFVSVERITVTWRCPHPDHQPPKCAECGRPPNAHSPTRSGGYLTGHRFVGEVDG